MAIQDISIRTHMVARQVAESGDTDINGGLEKNRNKYDKKQTEIQSRTSKSFNQNTGGFLTDVGTKLAGGTTPPIMSRSTMTLPKPPAHQIGSNNVQATGTYVSSVEELEYDMGSATREISEMIVGWSETFQNANLTKGEAASLTGASGFHYVIKRDGSIERDVPINSGGGHTPGHSSFSIGVLLIGGVDQAAPTQQTNVVDVAADVGASHITRSQYNSLYQIMRVFYTQYPGGQALGQSEVDPSLNGPGFEVRDYAYNLFNKISLFTSQGEMKSEKSPGEINAAVDPAGIDDIVDKDVDIVDTKF
jgi:N-acetylmuramoyl-L-alanine amidase